MTHQGTRINIGTKLLLSFLLIISVGIGALYIASQGLSSYQSNSADFTNRFQRILLIQDIELYSRRYEVAMTTLKTSPDASADVLALIAQYNNTTDNVTSELQQLNAVSDEVRVATSDFITTFKTYKQAINEQFVRQLQNEPSDAMLANITSQSASFNERLGQQADEVEALIEKNLYNAQVILDNEYQELTQFLWAAVVFLIGAGILLTYGLTRHIARPLSQLTLVAENISKGRLPEQIEVSGRNDEVGRLSFAFADMSAYLRELVEELNDGINVLATSSEEILTVTTKVAASTQETATAISEIATTIEEVKQTANVSGEKSKAVLESTKKTRAEAQHGRQSVEETLASMAEIREQMQAVASSIMRLGEQSQAIGEIVASVGELAEKSNLLGVNASIEAAKAGEAGKGFAIVAQEVKALADQSKDSTVQVRSILGEIQRAMNKAVMLAEQSSKAVEGGYEQAQTSGEVIQTLGSRIEENSEIATQIVTSSQQQNIGMDQIAQAMENIRQASQDNVSGAHQVDEAAKSLNQLGQKLQSLAARFKL
ncbi:methyl-accepting chemotaxis protein [Pseudidiomarina marina]|uniref:methyl-accepting chemotaxis protein n=1 Tax=Pseudidiomarina marina TaxID=502366 RepID=UPI00385060B5